MGNTTESAILFADLRSSTALYLKLGNKEAARLVTHSLALLGQIIEGAGGRVVKTLGDGLMGRGLFWLCAERVDAGMGRGPDV